MTPAPFAPEFQVSASIDGARDVVGADIDGDGDTDLVVAAQGDDEITWFENAFGNGTVYIPHMVTSMTDGVSSVAVADIDGDGNLDIVSASRYDDKISWFRNVSGNGTTWSEVVINDTVNDARSVFVVDMDGDGDLDVVTTSFLDDEVAWHDNTAGDGTAWTERVISIDPDGPTSAVASDIDGDGDIDVAVSSSEDDTVRWFENLNGVGTLFANNVISATTTGAADVHIADIDGDGDDDIAAAAYDDDEVVWFENNGAANPTFSEHVVSTTADGVTGVTVGDIDNDGDMDLLSASALDDSVALYENNGDKFDPLFSSRDLSIASNGANTVAVIDVDGDGDNDVVAASSLDDTIGIFRNNTIHGSAAFPVANPISSIADGAYAVAIGDIDGDGDLDIVSASLYDQTLQFYINNTQDSSQPIFNEGTIMPVAGIRDIDLADVDEDGTLDVVFVSAATNTLNVFRNIFGTGQTFAPATLATGLLAVRSVFVTNIDGDGDPDIITASSGIDAVLWTEIQGGFATTVTQIVATNVDGVRDAVAADIDGDGDMDVVSASYYDDRIIWHENTDGDGSSWAPRVIDTSANGARTVDVADIDGDGDMDIIAGSTYDHTVRWYENDGAANPTFVENVLSTTEQGVQDVAVADLDNDGDYDIVSVAQFPNAGDISRVALFLNDGAVDPTFTQQDIDTTTDRPNAVAIGDVTGDGLPDVVTTSMFDDTILVYRNGGGQLGLATEDISPPEFIAGETEALLKITATHNGRAGDSDLELATFEILLERSPGVPLTQAEANELIFDIEVWLDDGDGVFDADDDLFVLKVDPLVVDADGILTIFFDDDDPNALITLGTPRTYFIVPETTATAFLLDPKTFVMTHVTEASSTVEDAPNDIAGSIEFAVNVSTPLIDVGQPDVPLPGVPSFLGPVGAIDDPTPTFSWLAPVGAERYDLMVYDVDTGQLVIDQRGIIGTSFTPTAPLAVGRTYEAFVQAINVGNETGGFSTPEYFAIDPVTPVPAVPVLTGPAASIIDVTPTITWTLADTAVDYELLIYNVRDGVEILNPKAIAGTSFNIAAPLAPDHPYQVFVRAKNAGGVSAWSAPLNFDVSHPIGFPAAPILTGPARMIPDNTPTVTWTGFVGAIDYHLLIYSVSKGQEVLNVQGIGTTEFTTASLVAPDTYQVFVRARTGPGTFSLFSPPLLFTSTSAAPIPATPTIVTPSRDSTDGSPTIIWTDIAAALTYDVVAYNLSTGQQAFFANGQTSRHFTPGAGLVPGVYQVHVRAVNGAGEPGFWSAPLTFRVLTAAADTQDKDIDDSADDLQKSLEAEPQIPFDESALVSLERVADETAGTDVAAESHPQSQVVQISEATPQIAAANDVPAAAVELPEAPANDELASVMTEWPETEWWNHEWADQDQPAALNTADAALIGAAFGLALPAIQRHRKANDTTRSAPRRANDRRQDRR